MTEKVYATPIPATTALYVYSYCHISSTLILPSVKRIVAKVRVPVRCHGPASC